MSDLPDLTGKIVWVHVASGTPSERRGILLEFATLESTSVRLFLAGRRPSVLGTLWTSHLQMAIAWDSITYYVVFPSREDYLMRLEAVRRAQGKESA